MHHLVFLRGRTPKPHEHPERLEYDDILDCEDMWTQLFYQMLEISGASGDLVYITQGQESHKHGDLLSEFRVKDLQRFSPRNDPAVVLTRGGFPEYTAFVSRFPNAKRVYYGAGPRFIPPSGSEYDLVLCDSRNQADEVQASGYRVMTFCKPAARLFKPIPVKKAYDICFLANGAQAWKGHSRFINAFAGSGLRVLNLGNLDPVNIAKAKAAKLNITWGGWHRRAKLPPLICGCKLGVVCSTDGRDSSPRVVPEYLACDLPVVATTDVHMWEGYITPRTGIWTEPHDLRKAVKTMLLQRHQCAPAEVYNQSMSIDRVAPTLLQGIFS